MKRYKELYVFYSYSITMDGHSYKRHGLGGSESALTYMAQELAKRGKEVIVFCQTDTPDMYDGVRYERIEKFLSFIRVNIIDVFISVRSPDVFLHTIRARVKALWLHDATDQPHLSHLFNETVRKRIDYYITISEWQKKEFIKKFNISEEKIFASRNGILRSFYKVIRGNRKKRLVYTSTPFRGLEVLLELFPEIRKQVPGVELQVFSSMKVYGLSKESDQKQFGRLYEKCQQPGVTLVGSLPQRKLARALMEAKLLVYPNIFSETSCIAALEAQGAGLPVVAARRGALAETVIDGKSGYIIDNIHTDEGRTAFIDAIVHLLNNQDEWNAMSEYARKRVWEFFCWDTIADEWVRFFDRTKPTLSLCMIVKDEACYLKQSIDSVKSIVDEIIVVDTGSTDETKKVAQECGARVFDFTWCDDFSAARNFSLLQAKSDWILVLDADECVSNKDLRKVRQLLNVSESSAYLFFQRSYLNDPTVLGWKANTTDDEEGKEFAGFFDSPLTRLFRNHCGFQFEGKVHEIVEYSILKKKKTIINTDIPIHHYGKIRPQRKMLEKGNLYLEIGKERIKENPHDPRNYYDLGAQFFELGLIKEAKEQYENAINCDARFYRALCDLGILYAKENNYAEAIRLLESAIDINPQYVSSYVNLGIVYESAGRVDEAVTILRKALDIDPHHISAYKNLGLVYFSRGLYHDALWCFQKMNEIDTQADLHLEFATANYYVGLKYFENNDSSNAKKCFEEAIRLMPSFAMAYNHLGIINVNQGNSDKAEEQFKKAIELAELNLGNSPEYAKAYVNLGFLYNNKGLFTQAIAFLEKATTIDPSNVEIYNHIGIAKCGLGQLGEGVSFFETALKIDPDHQAAKVNLQRVQSILIQERNFKATIPKE